MHPSGNFTFEAISAKRAWENIAHDNANARWNRAPGDAREQDSARWRLNLPLFLPALRPRFRITGKDKVFCMGSCFARNVEQALGDYGVHVPMNDVELPFPGILNKYSLPSMLNELRWALEPETHPFPEDSLIETPTGVIDPHLSLAGVPRPREEALALRRRISAGVAKVASCRIVILTLGLVEAWRDNKVGVYLTEAPPLRACRKDPDRYELHILSYDANMAALEEIAALLQRHGPPDQRILLTVSPVPFLATFSSDDVVVANAYSKATLRAVAGDAVHRYEFADYLPSFEMVTHSPPAAAWEADRIHVPADVVDANVLHFLHHYIDGAKAPEIAARHRSLLARLRNAEAAAPMSPPDFESADENDAAFPAGLPVVTAASVASPELGPSALCEGPAVPWHAASPVTFPQSLEFAFSRPLDCGALWLQAQSRHPNRAPTAFVLTCFDENGAEHERLRVTDAEWRDGDQWRSWPLTAGPASNRYRLTIHAAGDPVLTVQRVWLSPAPPAGRPTSAASDAPAAPAAPHAVEAGFAGCNLVAYRGRIFAVAQHLGPLDLATLPLHELYLLPNEADADSLKLRLSAKTDASHGLKADLPISSADDTLIKSAPLSGERTTMDRAMDLRLCALEDGAAERDARTRNFSSVVNELRDRLHTLELTLMDRDNRLQALERALVDRDGRLRAVEDLLADRHRLSRSIDERFDALEAHLEGRLRTLNAGVAAQIEQGVAAETQRARTDDRFAEHNKMLKALENTIEERTLRLLTLERDANGVSDAVQGALSEMDKRISRTAMECLEAVQQILSIEDRLTGTASEADNFRAALDQQNAALVAGLAAADGKTDDLRLSLLEQDQTLQDLRIRLDGVEQTAAVQTEATAAGLAAADGKSDDLRLSLLEQDQTLQDLRIRLDGIEQTAAAQTEATAAGLAAADGKTDDLRLSLLEQDQTLQGLRIRLDGIEQTAAVQTEATAAGLAAADGKTDDLRLSLLELNQTLQDLRIRLDGVEQAAAVQTGVQAEALATGLAVADGKADDLRLALLEQSQTLQGLRLRLDEADAATTTLQNRFTLALQEVAQAFDRHVAVVGDKTDQASSQHKALVENITARFTSVEERFGNVVERIDQAAADVGALRNDVAARLDAMNETITAATERSTAEKAQIDLRLARLDDAAVDLTTQCHRVDDAVADLRIAFLEQRLAERAGTESSEAL